MARDANPRRRKVALAIMVVVGCTIAVGWWIWLRGRAPLGRVTAEATGARRSTALRITLPLANSLFPADMAPPLVLWKDDTPGVRRWRVGLGLEAEPPAVQVELQRCCSWRPQAVAWGALKPQIIQRRARLTVEGLDATGQVRSRVWVRFGSSPDRVDAPIFYRDVPLPFRHAVRHLRSIRWRLGRISSPRPSRVVMADVPRCANCHSFSRDGSTFGMNVDWLAYDGSFSLNRVQPRMLINAASTVAFSRASSRAGGRTAAFLNGISPDGRYVVTSVNDASVVIPGRPGELMFSFSAFFTYRGTLAVYDRNTRRFAPLPGADDVAFAHTNPVFSPDGSYLIFARAPALRIPEAEASGKPLFRRREVIERVLKRVKGFRYELFKIPFNGGRGGTPLPLAGASNNGQSNYFPKISPDGRWIVFCRAANFNLLQPDSRLFIVPAGGGVAREMRCNTGRLNSWHSFSPNGRWLVFSSKARGPHTELYLTHIDQQGRDTPAVLLDRLSIPGRAVNIPEFVNVGPKFEMQLQLHYP